MIYLTSADKTSNKRSEVVEIRKVETQEVVYDDLVLSVKGNGVIKSKQSLDIISEATGKVLYAKNNLKNGTFFIEGEVILRIDSREVENNLFSFRSDFMNSVASMLPEIKNESIEQYEKWYKYFNTLDINKKTQELPPTTDTREKIKVSSRNVYSKYYLVQNQEILLSKHKITAPFDGYLSNSELIENSYISRGQKLFTLIDAKNLEIAVPLLVDEVNLINFSNSPLVKIYSQKDQSKYLQGRINRRDISLDQDTQTINAYVSFKNSKLSSDFLPGNYVEVGISGRKLSNVAVIPRHLIDNENNVFVMEDGKLVREKVDIITYQQNSAIVSKSIRENSKLITTILQKPLIGMNIESINHPEPIEEEVADSGSSENTTSELN
ncbi:MAG: efflux RND transporter periplasmic adaptor subunit [Melioribacteraceae bacterium]|nr:efflux RND transporter periplasmic adaptor subunit [Melioribacteraceae bacterium]